MGMEMEHESGLHDEAVYGNGAMTAAVVATVPMYRRSRRWWRLWAMALVCAVITACGGGGGGGSGGSGENDGSSDSPDGDPVSVESVSLNPESLLLETGDDERASITATLHLSNGDIASRDSEVDWSLEPSASGRAEIVETNGTTATLEGQAVGQTRVTAKSGDQSATADVFISESVTLQVRPSSVFLPAQCSEPLTARLITDAGVTQDVTQDVTWSVSDSDALAVGTGDSDAGVVESATPDTTPVASVVSAAHRDRRATGRVTVAELAAIDLLDRASGDEVTDQQIGIAPEEPRGLNAVGSFEPDSEFPEFPERDVTDCVAWSSGNEDAATVSGEGVVTGVSEGRSTVQAVHDSGTEGSVEFEVRGRMTGFSIKGPDELSLLQGAREQLRAEAEIDGGDTRDITAAVDWDSDQPAIATVSNNSGSEGRVTGVATGQAVVTAALSEFPDDSVTVTVEPAAEGPGALSLSADPNAITAGDEAEPSRICGYLLTNDNSDPVADTAIDFSIVDGNDRVTLSDDGSAETGTSGKAACVDLAPQPGSEAGSTTVRAEEPESGLAETVDVALVNSFADVFDTSGEIDPPIAEDGSVSAGTVFEAVLENGSNRAFTLGPGSVSFCNGGKSIEISTSGLPEDGLIDAGDRIGLSVKITTDREDDGFALVVDSGDPEADGGEFKIIHEFTPGAEDCP